MHIPDGFLNPPVIASTYALSAGGLAFIWQKVKTQFNEKTVPKIAMLAAFIFVAQMINIPISGGTSGHLVGGLLAALFIGPFASIFVLSLVLIVQMFIFQDGGLTALGANIFNMGFIGVTGGYFFYYYFTKFIKSNVLHLTGIFLSAWLAVEFGALFTGIELGLAGLADTKITISLMVGIHALIGLLEGIMTVLIYEAVRAIRPDLIYVQHHQPVIHPGR